MFGANNVHSFRLHSCFRYARTDVPLADLSPELMTRLEAARLVPSNRYANQFAEAPEELRGVWLRKPEERERLMAEFACGRVGAERPAS